VARGGCGAEVPPLAARPTRRVLEKIPGQLEASFLIFPTLGSIHAFRGATAKLGACVDNELGGFGSAPVQISECGLDGALS